MDWRKFDPSWARKPLARATREVIITGIFGNLIEFYVHPERTGLEVFDGIKAPVVFAANHSSHMDTPTILGALPREWRRKTATIAAADYFFTNRILASLVTLSFATVPIERVGGVSRLTAERLGRLVAEGWSMLIYPEGTRSRSGQMAKLRSGAGYLAAEHRLPLVPIYMQGTHDAMPVGRPWPRRRAVRINFGSPLYPVPGEDHRAVTLRLEEAFKKMREEIPPPPKT